MFLAAAAFRVAYPFPLEWQEGGMLQHAERVASGQPVYVEPALDFAPFPYPPLFYWLGGASVALFGAAPAALRGIAIAASLVALALLAREGARVARGEAAHGAQGTDLGRSAAHRAAAALGAAGVLAAGAGFGGWFLDLARVDALALAAMLATLALARRAADLRGAVVAGIAASVALAAKQTALVPCAALALPMLARGPRLAALYLAVIAAAATAGLALLDARSDGWASFTIVDTLAGSPFHRPAVLGFWRESLVALGPLVAAALVARARMDAFAASFALGLVVVAWVGRAHEGGFDNTLLPAVAAAALLAAAVLRSEASRRRALPSLLVALGIGWLAVRGGDPRDVIPGERDRAAAERAVAELAALPAPAFVPDAPWLAELAGHPPAIHAMAVVDLLKSGQDAVARAFVQRLEGALGAHEFASVVLAAPPWDLPALEAAYARSREIDVPAPKCGAQRAPRIVYLPR